jgi:hypothetical protein
MSLHHCCYAMVLHGAVGEHPHNAPSSPPSSGPVRLGPREARTVRFMNRRLPNNNKNE